MYIGTLNAGYTDFFTGYIPEIMLYNKALTTNEQNLVEQYQAAKWGITLDPLTGAGMEIAEATAHNAGNPTDAATNGYNVFTTRYLERLAGSADLVLHAATRITLDLKGDTLNLTGGSNIGKSITLQTDNGNITDVSAGTIRTSRMGAGVGQQGNISLIAGGAGNIQLYSASLEAQNGGSVSATAGGNITLNNITAGGNIDISATGAGKAITTTGALASTAGGNISLTADDLILAGNLSGTASLTLRPQTVSKIMRVNFGNGDFNLSTAELAYLQDGWSQITIGRSNAGRLWLGGSTWSDPVSFLSGADMVIDNGDIIGTGNASVSLNPHTVIDLRNNITLSGGSFSSGGSLNFSAYTGNRAITTNGGSATFNKMVLNNNASYNELAVNTSGGNIQFNDTLSMAGTNPLALTLNAGAGTASFANTLNGLFDLNATARTFTIGAAIGGMTALGNVSLTSTNALNLPAVTATSFWARTTETASDITLGGNINAAATSGTSILLAAGRDVENTGNRTLSTAGTARWLTYSGDIGNAATTKGGLTGFNRYGCTYNAGSPSCAPGTDTPTSGNGFYFAYAPTLSIAGLSGANKVYDATAAASTNGTATLNGVLYGDAVSVDASAASLVFADKNVGTGRAITANGYALDGFNHGYLLTQPTGFTADITKAPLNVSLNQPTYTRQQGQANPAFTVMYSGFINPEDATVLTTSPSANTLANLTSPAGSYAVTLGGGLADNYDFFYTDSILNVTAGSSTGGGDAGGSGVTLPASWEHVASGNQNLYPDQVFYTDNSIYTPWKFGSPISYIIALEDETNLNATTENETGQQDQSNERKTPSQGIKVIIQAELAKSLGLTQEKSEKIFQ